MNQRLFINIFLSITSVSLCFLLPEIIMLSNFKSPEVNILKNQSFSQIKSDFQNKMLFNKYDNILINHKVTVLALQENNFFLRTMNPHKHEGFNADLLEYFQKTFGSKLNLIIYNDENKMFDDFQHGIGDLLVGPFYRNEQNQDKFNVISNNGAKISCISKDRNDISNCKFSKKNRNYLINAVDLNFYVNKDKIITWFYRNNLVTIKEYINTWTKSILTLLVINKANKIHFEHLGVSTYFELMVLSNSYKQKFKPLKKDFISAANIHKIDHLLLASIAYKESHWNPNAVSYTGVKGLMMLTQRTASELGVTNRLDPLQSLYGGAKYFKRMLTLFPSKESPEKIWFALASYNVGYGHVIDAKNLATEKGLDPEKWINVKQVLPLISRREYRKKLKYGIARGNEAVRYVSSIKVFWRYLYALENAKQLNL